MLGVNTAANDGDESMDALSAEVRNVMPKGADAVSTDIYGDYRVCPFTKSRPGRMQYVCIARASRLIANPR
jgi:hypothetical protein